MTTAYMIVTLGPDGQRYQGGIFRLERTAREIAALFAMLNVATEIHALPHAEVVDMASVNYSIETPGNAYYCPGTPSEEIPEMDDIPPALAYCVAPHGVAR